MSMGIRAAAAPFWAFQLATGAKSFEHNPIIGSSRLNRWGLHARRVQLAYSLAEARRARLAAGISPEDRAAFDRDGFIVRRDFLPDAVFRRLLGEVQSYRGPFREKAEGRSVLRKVVVGKDVLDSVPTLADVQRSSVWQGLIRYAGARDAAPSLFLQAVLQHAADGDDDPQTALHADTFHPTVKAWLFLTDVEEGTGPFTFVRGSHRLTPERLAWETRTSLSARRSSDFETRQGSFRIRESELEQLRLPQPEAVAVPANTLVVADTFGFHARGRSVRPSTRVEVWGIGQRNPFLPWTSLDRLIGAVGSVGRTGNDWDVRRGISIFDTVGRPGASPSP